MSTQATEIVPGALYRLGGVVPIDGRLSWRPAAARGFEPVSCFLLLEPETALLVGTGVRLHERAILAQLRGLVGDRELQVYADRNEADQIGNLAAVVRAFGVRRIWFAGAGHLLRWFDHDGFDGAPPTDCDITFLLPAGTSRAIDLESSRPSTVDFGAGRLELLHTTLTTLGFAWLYDRTTRTLFSSDFFSEAALPDATAPVVTDAADVTAADTAEHLGARFYWMADADPEPLLANLAAIVDGRPIDRFCPYHGFVVEGQGAVRRLVAHVRNALTRTPAVI